MSCPPARRGPVRRSAPGTSRPSGDASPAPTRRPAPTSMVRESRGSSSPLSEAKRMSCESTWGQSKVMRSGGRADVIPVPPRFVRRIVLAPVVLACSLLLVLVSPVLFVVAAVADLFAGGRRTLRFVAFGVTYCAYEVAGIVAVF